MRIVAYSTGGFLRVLVVNCCLLLWQAFRGDSPALPHVPDQQFIVLAVWGVLIPHELGLQRALAACFRGAETTEWRWLLFAYVLGLARIAATFLSLLQVAGILFLLSALLTIDALHVWERAMNPPKLLNVHPSFAWFARLTYIWLLASCGLTLLAVDFDHAGGFSGDSCHALTVGFMAGMVFTIGQHVLPLSATCAFFGARGSCSGRYCCSLLVVFCAFSLSRWPTRICGLRRGKFFL